MTKIKIRNTKTKTTKTKMTQINNQNKLSNLEDGGCIHCGPKKLRTAEI